MSSSNMKLIIFSILIFFGVCMTPKLFETNTFGNYQIKQAAVSGDVTVRNEPGVYFQGFGSIETYAFSEDIDFADHQVEVRFNDGSVAQVFGTVKFRMPGVPEKQKALHRDYGTFRNVVNDLVVKNVKEALSQTATLMVAEDSYSTRRGEFASVAEQQAKLGIFETTSREIEAVDENGTRFKKLVVELAKDTSGKSIVRKESLLNQYGVEILQFVVNDFKYDDKVTDMIAQKKVFANQKMVAATEAETAKQNAITESEQGKARVAKAEADALVVKKTAVIEAEKQAEIARLDAIKADHEAKATLARGKADAETNRLKVAAGLTPLEKATIEKEIAIGVAEKLSGIHFPSTLIISGGDSKGANPFDAIGMNAFYDLSKKMSQTK